jgi:hypothetical protein
MYEIIKKFLNDGGKCLLIENDKPVGVILTIEEYELLKGKSPISNLKSQTNPETEKTLFSETEDKPVEATATEMDFPEEELAAINEIEAAEDVTLEDLNINEPPY